MSPAEKKLKKSKNSGLTSFITMKDQKLQQLVKEAKRRREAAIRASLQMNWFHQLKAKYGSIPKVAKLLGIDRSAIYKWNRCETPMPIKHIQKIKELLN